VFRDLNFARNTFENDKELAWIADAFRLSEYALSHDPYQLAPHIIDMNHMTIFSFYKL
jgi:hypothetical protein